MIEDFKEQLKLVNMDLEVLRKGILRSEKAKEDLEYLIECLNNKGKINEQ